MHLFDLPAFIVSIERPLDDFDFRQVGSGEVTDKVEIISYLSAILKPAVNYKASLNAAFFAGRVATGTDSDPPCAI